jgi:hypothetical protein
MSAADVRKARSRLAIMTRFRGPDHPDTLSARAALIAAKMAVKQAELDQLAAELRAAS